LRAGGGRGRTCGAIRIGLCAGSLLLGGIDLLRAEAAEAPEGRLLVLNKHDDTLMVFEVPSNRRLATIKVGREPHEVAATPDGRKAYVANARGGSVSVVNLKTYEVARTLRSANLALPHGLEVTPDGRYLLVTSEDSRRLFLVDVVRDAIVKTITTTQKRAHMVSIFKGGRRACVANIESDSVTLLSLPDMRILRHLKVGDGPEGIAVTPNGKWILVALQGSDQMAILSASGGEVLARLPTGRTPVRVAVTPNSFTALVSNRGSNDVTLLDLLTRRVRANVPVGRRPGGVVAHPRGTRAYVCNNDSNTVSVVSITGAEVTAEIETGAHPDGITFVPERAQEPRRAPARPRRKS
jgi:YVTN family beta-propeller protein